MEGADEQTVPARHRVDDSAVEVGPHAAVAAERARLEHLRWERFGLRPLGATVGAEVGGLDLTGPLADDVVDELRRALLAHKILVFRDQPMTPAQHVALTERFGPAGIHPLMAPSPDHPGVEHVERGTGSTGFENAWHSDISWHPTPAMGTILHALSVPAAGGDTLFADAAAAHDALPADRRDRLAGLTAAHDFGRVVAHQRSADELDDLRRRHPASHHPVVRTHPESGRRALYVNEYFTASIDGLDPDEGDELLADLCRWIERPEFQFRLRWEDHTVALWDNRTTQHYACSDYWPATRIMERTLIGGDAPR
ncbi:MAG: TauD/TfdA family dioxygenase [Acidimicrobiales bacterium]|nr:TauD/TfdA family dioxygenase [Acidimicrobiales bacterium]